MDYLFCVAVDMVFRNPWGPETLRDLVAAIRPRYFAVPHQQLPYERRQVPSAFVADSEGDFYYGGAVFGRRVARVYEYLWDDRKTQPPILKTSDSPQWGRIPTG